MNAYQRPSVIRGIAQELRAAAANSVIFLVAFFIGLRVIYTLVFSAFGVGGISAGSWPALSEVQAMTGSVSLAFLLFAGLAAAWTRSLANIVATSAASFLLGVIAVAQAMYLADRGDPSMMWQFIRLRPAQWLGSVLASGAAGFGWYTARRFFWRKRVGDTQGAAEQAHAADVRRDV